MNQLFPVLQDGVQGSALLVLGRLFERVSEAMLVFSPDTGRIELANHQACMTLGYARGELYQMAISEICNAVSADEQVKIAENLANGIPCDNIRTSFRRRVGTYMPARIRCELVQTTIDPLIAIFVTDLSGVSHVNSLHELAIDNPTQCFTSMNLDTWEIQRDPALDYMYGFAEFDPSRTAHVFMELVAPEYRDIVFEQFVQLSQCIIEKIDLCFRVVTVDGKTKWIHGVGRLSEHDPRMVVGLQTDVTEQQESRIREAETKDQLSRMRGVLASREKEFVELLVNLPDVVTRATPDTVLTFTNKRYCDFLGLPEDQILGRSFFDFIPEEGKALTRAALGELTPENPMVTFEQPMGDPESDQWYLWSNQILYDADKNPVEIISVGRDISELVRARKELNDSYSLLARKNETLERFSGTVAHDLKLPIRNIALLARMTEDNISGGDPDKAIANARQIVSVAESMTGLIDGLMEFSQIAYQDISLEMVDLSEAAGDARRHLWSTMSETDASLQIGSLPVAKGNHELLVRLFQHVIANSIKFRRPGSKPVIAITGQSDSSGITVYVTDNGIGIDPNYKDWVFGMFQRLHREEGELPGTGIGLTLARQIAEKHEGSLDLDTSYSDGARFVLKLPRKVREMTKFDGK